MAAFGSTAAPVDAQNRSRKPAARPAPPAKAPARPPAPAEFARLEILPSEVRLHGPQARQRLVVMGVRPDGTSADVTDRAVIGSSVPNVAEVDAAVLESRADGRGAVVARLGSLRTDAPVSVQGSGAPIHYSFEHDVVPVLARLGCSQGACHGANSGKGGFKLSLRGYAPELDFLSITREQRGRRISREEPERSLLLRKPLMEVAHGGGRVLENGSREYYTLLGWLMQGAPGMASTGEENGEPRLASLETVPGDRLYRPRERQQVIVLANYSDGSTRDVTDRAVFTSNDPSVAEVSTDGEILALNPGVTAVQAKYMDQLGVARVTVPFPQRVDPDAFRLKHNYIDAAVHNRLWALNLEPSGLCTDEEFIRRVYVDALGTLPTADEVRRFLGDSRPRKRDLLVNEVLQRPEYGLIWALKLCDLFMVRKEHMQRKNTVALQGWLAEQFNENRGWDEIVIDLLTAEGAIEERPETLWWASRQQVRPGGRGWVRHYELTGEIAAQVFLGQRIQCAKCHNHPTERYTQDDYYRFAAVFAQVNGEGRANPVPERFVATDPGEVRHPRTGMAVLPAALDGRVLEVPEGEDRRQYLARWLRGDGREYFSRNIANRVWARLFGTGIVDPVDDLRSTNPPRNEELLAALAKDLVSHQYDLKYLMGTIMRSRTYQATAVPTEAGALGTQFFAHYPVRRIPAEELIDGIAQVTGVPDKFVTYPLGTRAIELSDSELQSLSLDTFGRPSRVSPCDCDRTDEPSLSQALDLFNGDGLQEKLKHPEGTVARLLKSDLTDAQVVQELFLAAQARRPNPTELAESLRAIHAAPGRAEGVQDVLWALINSKEFMFNR
jgi:hypothetical protein